MNAKARELKKQHLNFRLIIDGSFSKEIVFD
jgi:hypothetical protein